MELRREVVGTPGRKGTLGMQEALLDALGKVPTAAQAALLHLGEFWNLLCSVLSPAPCPTPSCFQPLVMRLHRPRMPSWRSSPVLTHFWPCQPHSTSGSQSACCPALTRPLSIPIDL